MLWGVIAWPTPSWAQVKVIISGGFSVAYHAVLPDFERTTGIRVTTTSGPSQGNTPDVIGTQLRRGVPADVVIMSREGLNELITEGRIVAGSDVDLAKTPLGLAVRAGAPTPDISTVNAFKQTLLRAKSVAFPSSTTGIYLVRELFPRLGIVEAMSVKSSHAGASAVAGGEVEIAIRPASELLSVPGIAYVGPVPADVQFVSVFAAAVVSSSTEIAASRRLIAYLASDKATVAVKNSGMEQSRPRAQ